MADRIHVEISGESKDLVAAAAAAAASVKLLGREVRSVDTDSRRSAVGVGKLGKSVIGFNQSATLMRNIIATIKWPVLITGAGLAAQALSAAAVAATALVGALAPLSGLLVTLPAGLLAIGQGMVAWKLAAGELTKALGGNEEALKRLPPAARSFYDELQKLKPQIKELRESVGAKMFPGLETGVSRAMKNLGAFQKVLTGTGGAVGMIAARFGALVGSKGFGRQFQLIGNQANATLMRLSKVAMSLTRALLDLMVAAMPFLKWIGETTVHLAKLIEKKAEAGRESGRLAGFFNLTRKSLELLAPLLADTWGALSNIAAAARPLGFEILRALGSSAKGWREWTESLKGRNALADYFHDAKPLIFELGRLVRDLTTAFFRLGRDAGGTELVRQIRTEVLPAVEHLIAGMTKAFGPHVIALIVSLAKTFEVLMGPTGALTILVDLLRLASDFLRALIDTPGLGGFATQMITVAGVWKGLKWGGAIAAAERLSGLWKGIAVASTETAVASGAGGAAGGAAKGAATGAAGGAVAAGGLKGVARGLSPIARKAGLIGIGISLLSGATAAFGDKSRQADFGGKLKNFLGGALGFGATDFAAKGREIRDQILKGAEQPSKSVPVGRGAFGRQTLDPEAGLNGQTQKALAALRKTRAQAEKIFGKTVVLKVGVNPGDLGRIESNFRRLKQGSDISLKQLQETTTANMKLLARNLDLNSKEGQDAVVRNFRGGLRGVKRLLADGVIDTDQAGRQIKRLLDLHSGAGKDALARNFNAAERTIAKTMRNAQGITKAGMEQIRALMADEMRAYGFSDVQIRRSLNLTKSGERRDPLTGKSPDTLGGKARGGMVQFGKAGAKGRDTIPARMGGRDIMVGSGELGVVLNADQQAELNARTADMGGLRGFFRKVKRPHYMAGGGWVGQSPAGLNPAVKSIAQWAMGKYGASASSTFRPGDPGFHGRHMAVDLVSGNMDAMAAGIGRNFTPKLLEGIHNPNLSVDTGKNVPSSFWGAGTWAGHVNHVHVAAMGRALKGMAAKLKRVMVGGQGPLHDIVQSGLDKTGRAAQAKLDSLTSTQGGGDFGSFTGPWTEVMAKIAESRGWNLGDWKQLVQNESGGQVSAQNPTSTAFGLGQLLDSTQATYGGGPGSSGTEQIAAMAAYIAARYGNPTKALAFWNAQGPPHWYSGGGPPDPMSYLPGAVRESAPHGKGPGKGTPHRPGFVTRETIAEAQIRVRAARKAARKARHTVAGGLTPEAHARFQKKAKHDKQATRRKLRKAVERVRKLKGRRAKQFLNIGPDLKLFRALGIKVEDETGLTSIDETTFSRAGSELSEDETPGPGAGTGYGPTERNQLITRHQTIHDLLAQQLGLATDKIEPGFQANLGARRREIKILTARVQKIIAEMRARRRELERTRDQITTLEKKKHKTEADKTRLKGLREHAGNVRHRVMGLAVELGRLTGQTDESSLKHLGQLRGGDDGFLGAAQQARDNVMSDLSDIREQIRPSQLPSAIAVEDSAIADLKAQGAVASGRTPAMNSELATLLGEQVRELARKLAVKGAQLDTFKGMLPLVGSYAHGALRVPQTGLALVHKDEQIVPDRQGPYGSQLADGGGIGRDAPQVTVIVKGGIGKLMDGIEVLVDNKIVDHKERLDQRSRTFARGPGRS